MHALTPCPPVSCLGTGTSSVHSLPAPAHTTEVSWVASHASRIRQRSVRWHRMLHKYDRSVRWHRALHACPPRSRMQGAIGKPLYPEPDALQHITPEVRHQLLPPQLPCCGAPAACCSSPAVAHLLFVAVFLLWPTRCLSQPSCCHALAVPCGCPPTACTGTVSHTNCTPQQTRAHT